MAGSEKQIYQIAVTDTNIQDNDWFPRDRDTDKVTVKAQYSDLVTYLRDKIVGNLTPGSVLFVDNSGKIGEDNDKFNFSDNDDTLAVGAGATTINLDGTTKQAAFLGVSDGQAERWGVAALHFSSSEHSALTLLRARGSKASPQDVKAEDDTGAILFGGYKSTNYGLNGCIHAIAESDFTASNSEGRIEFHTTPNGSTTPVLGFTVTSAQKITTPSTLSINTNESTINYENTDFDVGLFIRESATTAAVEIAMTSYGTGRLNGVHYFHANGTEAAPTIAADNDWVMIDRHGGYDGSTYRLGAEFSTRIDGTPAANVMPMEFLWATENASGTFATRMNLRASGDLGLGTELPQDRFHVTGTDADTRMRIQNTGIAGNRNAGYISKNTSDEFFSGVSIGPAPRYVIYDNNNTRAHIACDVNNYGVILGADKTDADIIIDSTTRKIKAVTEYDASDTDGFVGINHDATNPVSFLGAVSNGTIATPTIAVNNQPTVSLQGTGYNGSHYELMGKIEGQLDAAPGASSMPGRWVISTTPDASVTPAEALRIDKTQAVAIGTGASADASALVEMTSTTRGLLPPRMTTTQRDAIASPATGLMIYNTTTNQWEGYNGTSWTILG